MNSYTGFQTTAHKEKKTEQFGAGLLVQIIGVLLCLTIIGAVLGIPLIIVGGKMARKLKCSNCGNGISDKGVRICPTCGYNLA
jgi:rRNA maturation endonuclease Nob1